MRLTVVVTAAIPGDAAVTVTVYAPGVVPAMPPPPPLLALPPPPQAVVAKPRNTSNTINPSRVRQHRLRAGMPTSRRQESIAPAAGSQGTAR